MTLSEASIDQKLEALGIRRTGAIEEVKDWARSRLVRIDTTEGSLWIKQPYRLPPGEERVLSRLAPRWRDRVPEVLADWPGGFLMRELPGRELAEDDPLEAWESAARVLGEIAAGEIAHVDEWLATGTRDRRPQAFRRAVARLLKGPVVRALDRETYTRFDELVPAMCDDYERSFRHPPTLVHQDSGCCNIHVSESGPVIFDWADVVVGHPAFSCDRLLDQVPAERKSAVIDAFRVPLDLSLDEFRDVRRANVLHEVLRYHDELPYMDDASPTFASLANSVRSQIEVIVQHSKK